MSSRKKHIVQTVQTQSVSDRLVVGICTLIVLMSFVLFVYPVVYVLVSSVSTASMRNFSIIPSKISLEGYKQILSNPTVWKGFWNSVQYTTVGTFVSLFLTILFAYPMSKVFFYTEKYVSYALIFVMYFSGGMIPTYLLLKKLGMLNTMWALIFPSCISVYNIFLLRNYFKTKIPEELYEAARLDGCGHLRYLLYIVLPMSKPILSVLALFYSVSYWNSYFSATIYITDRDKLPLINVLNNILIKQDTEILNPNVYVSSEITAIELTQMLEYALIVVSVVPILVVLFFARKAFVQYKESNFKF